MGGRRSCGREADEGERSWRKLRGDGFWDAEVGVRAGGRRFQTTISG